MLEETVKLSTMATEIDRISEAGMVGKERWEEIRQLRFGLPVSCCSLYTHVLPSISRRSARLPLPLASPDVTAFPTIPDGVDLRITVFGICTTFTTRCGPRGRQTTQRWSSTPKALTASLPPRPLRLLPAGEAVAGWVYLPLRSARFHGAREKTASGERRQCRRSDLYIHSCS
jgi:hypothetical protein